VRHSGRFTSGEIRVKYSQAACICIGQQLRTIPSDLLNNLEHFSQQLVDVSRRSGRYSPTSDFKRGRPGSIPGDSMWDLWWIR
jgi:hypothetical protein